MTRLDEVEISTTILCTYHEKLLDRIASDVIIVGAGPSGLVTAFFLAKSGVKVTVLEKRLSPGGGIWGGGMAMNVAVVQEEAVPLLDSGGIRCEPRRGNLHAVDRRTGCRFVLERPPGRRLRAELDDHGRSLPPPGQSDWRGSQPHHHFWRPARRPDRVFRESYPGCDWPWGRTGRMPSESPPAVDLRAGGKSERRTDGHHHRRELRR